MFDSKKEMEWLELEFTPLEFETYEFSYAFYHGILLEFTPLEFETQSNGHTDRWIL